MAEVISQIDELVESTLRSFATEVLGESWEGRFENEARSLYVFGHLVPACKKDSFFYDPAQIGLEVTVPQIAAETQRGLSKGKGKPKPCVWKDVVIWERPKMTCWQDGKAVQHPIVVIEMKFNQAAVSGYDVDWLKAFSSQKDKFIGYALCIDKKRRNFGLTCTRVHNGIAKPDWLFVR